MSAYHRTLGYVRRELEVPLPVFREEAEDQ
jgi:hypothetical protein